MERPHCVTSLKGPVTPECFKKYSIIIWDECTMAHMRALESLNATIQDLLALGNGKAPFNPETGLIQFPSNFCTQVKSADDLMDVVFPCILPNYYKPDWIRERALLGPKNASVANLYLQALRMLPGNEKSYNLIDTFMDSSKAVNYPTEFLNSLDSPGCPPYVLHLKFGAQIFLLQNLESPKLCNGMRLIIKTPHSNLIEIMILNGCGTCENVFIPPIPIIPNDLLISFKACSSQSSWLLP
ncbi:uncharacterized protein [Palaemon carinicauda]|uniref:uncharacterized protein n=1 Tax=Palaemon carinicauda TaxID=392227 RepID=UPI0035B60028